MKKVQNNLSVLAGGIAHAIVSYFQRTASKNSNFQDDMSEEELKCMQALLMQQAAIDVGLNFGSKEEINTTEFKEKLRKAIFKNANTTENAFENAIKKRVCVELDYCAKVGDNWRSKLFFGAGLSLVTLLVDITGVSASGILYLLAIGYFDELCGCKKSDTVGA